MLARAAAALQARHALEVRTAFKAEPELSPASREALYRVAQEATHNVTRQAQATCVVFYLGEKDGAIVLEIRDDGIGFDPQRRFPGHSGFQSMRERVEGFNGQVTIKRAPRKGTAIQARILAGSGGG